MPNFPGLSFRTAVAPYRANPANFNPADARLVLSTVGAPSSSKGLISIKIRRQTIADGTYILADALNGAFLSLYWDANRLRIGLQNRLFYPTTTISTTTGWHRLHISYDRTVSEATQNTQIYVDGVSDYVCTNQGIINDIDLSTMMGIVLGSAAAGSQAAAMDCSIADFFWDTQHNLDLSVSANLAKLENGSGKPVDAGTTGSLVTGSQPLVYLNKVASIFEQNVGYGGNFTRFGTITTASTSPSD